MRKLRLATRGSKLALAQSDTIATMLQTAHPGLQVELQIVQTKGDAVQDRPISKIGDKGLFVKEIEQALLNGEADFAVHSCKDLESTTPDGLLLAAFPLRADARDVLISRHGLALHKLLPGARIGTSSLRRACQIKHLRPDVEIVTLRGNVDTRLRKAQSEEYDAIVLAAAGLERLAIDQVMTEVLDVDTFIPMVGQGALAVECRADDAEVRRLLAPLNHGPTALAVRVERQFLARLAGGCQAPIAAHATFQGDGIRLRGLIGTPDGQHVVRGERVTSLAATTQLGVELADALLADGGAAILERLKV
jgi:hydroxymethylbilane synthase